jgi:periplasmic protein TonB
MNRQQWAEELDQQIESRRVESRQIEMKLRDVVRDQTSESSARTAHRTAPPSSREAAAWDSPARRCRENEVETTESGQRRHKPFDDPSNAASPEASSLLAIAAELRFLPTPEFKNQLKADLEEEAEALTQTSGENIESVRNSETLRPEIMPSLNQREFSMLPADPRSFLFSFVSHVVLVVLIASAIWASHRTIITTTRFLSSELTYPGHNGGGGGGERNTVQTSRGTPPKFSDQQITPPAIVVRNPNPKLPVDSTVLGPPSLKLPQSNRLGDLMSSNVVFPSNGTGSEGGTGSKSGTGLGDGNGAGVGNGKDAGTGGRTSTVGRGVRAPRAIYDPEPEYSDEARKMKHEGTVVLSIIVDAEGRARNIHVARSLGMGLDEKAIEAVKKWKFEPGKEDGQPVAVQVNVEVNFRLY